MAGKHRHDHAYPTGCGLFLLSTLASAAALCSGVIALYTIWTHP